VLKTSGNRRDFQGIRIFHHSNATTTRDKASLRSRHQPGDCRYPWLFPRTQATIATRRGGRGECRGGQPHQRPHLE
jgi:hypothetical protein